MRLGVQDAAELLGVSEKTIYRWIGKGTLPAYRVMDQYRFNRAELLAWAISQRLNVPDDLFHDSLRVTGAIPTMVEAVSRGGIVYRLEGKTKEDALRHLADTVRVPEAVDRNYLYHLLLARESLGPTGVGDGIAIPQLVYPNALEASPPVITIAFLDTSIDYDAMDGVPVTCLVGLISPSVRAYNFLLNRLYYALRDTAMRLTLDASSSREQILSELTRVESFLRKTPEYVAPAAH